MALYVEPLHRVPNIVNAQEQHVSTYFSKLVLFLVSSSSPVFTLRHRMLGRCAYALMVITVMGLAGCGGGESSSGSNPNKPGNGNPPIVVDQPHIKGPVDINWSAPEKRENGLDLDITEIGGYEIRYKTKNGNYQYVLIRDAWTQEYHFDWLEGDYLFEIAAFDQDGLYSNYVPILIAE